MERVVLNVEGMSCEHCVNAVKNALDALYGVSHADVSLDDKTVTVVYDAEKVSLENITDAIEDEGYLVI